MSRHWICNLVVLLSPLALAASRADAAGLYSYTDLGDFGPRAINAQGMVVSNPTYGVVAPSAVYMGYGPYAGQIVTIPNSFIAQGINAQGQVISGTPTGGSILSELDTSGSSPSYRTVASDSGTYLGINDRGQIVGESASQQPFLIDGGKKVDLGPLGQQHGEARAINASGQFAGILQGTPGLFSNGSFTAIGSLGDSASFPIALNAAGQVVGLSQVANGEYHAFLSSGGRMLDLGTLGSNSGAAGINASGQVVGTSWLLDGTQHAYLYSDGVMRDLNGLVPLPAGWSLTSAAGINDAGQIIGEARDAEGNERGYLLTPAGMAAPASPVPEPGTLAVFGLAAFGLALRRLRGRAA